MQSNNTVMTNFNHFKTLWDASETTFPLLEKRYSFREKRIKEAKLDLFFHALKEGIDKNVVQKEKIDDASIFSMMERFFKEGLDYTEEQLAVILSPEMINATRGFISKARQFDSSISLDSIFQACRNIWIMNGIQYVLGVPVYLSPSIFAYSMLYPYTDNFVDDPTISPEEKLEFSHRFAERLKGKVIKAENFIEEKINILVSMIEEEWDRNLYPEVYTSLLAIHKAQTDSMYLISDKNLSQEDTFRICVEKGGTSVVADGYLILGKLTSSQEKFLYDYGAYLQLLDDIQDVGEDQSRGLLTYFSKVVMKDRLDHFLSRTYHLGFKIMSEVDLLNPSDSSAFKSLMKKSIDLFLIEAIITNSAHFSWWYMMRFKVYSPFRYSYVKKKSSTLSPYQKMLFQNIEEYALANEDQEQMEVRITA